MATQIPTRNLCQQFRLNKHDIIEGFRIFKKD